MNYHQTLMHFIFELAVLKYFLAMPENPEDWLLTDGHIFQ